MGTALHTLTVGRASRPGSSFAETSTYEAGASYAQINADRLIRSGAPQFLPEIPEHELIRQVRDGSNAACELLFRRYERPVYKLCMCVTVSGGRSAGPPREGLLQLYRRIDTFRADNPRQGLIHRVVNKLLRLRGLGLRLAKHRSRAEVSSWTVKRRTVLIRTW